MTNPSGEDSRTEKNGLCSDPFCKTITAYNVRNKMGPEGSMDVIRTPLSEVTKSSLGSPQNREVPSFFPLTTYFPHVTSFPFIPGDTRTSTHLGHLRVHSFIPGTRGVTLVVIWSSNLRMETGTTDL